MQRPRTDLARRPAAASSVVYTAGEHAPEYTLSHTGLGEFALQWNADWLTGLFCVNDFPTEWIAYVHAAFCGAWHEGVYDDHGAGTPFSAVAWDLSPWERAVGPFSQVPLGVWMPHDPLWSNVDLDALVAAEARTNPAVRKQLPLIRSLALPDDGASTL